MGPLFMDLNIPSDFKKSGENMYKFWKSTFLKFVGKGGCRRILTANVGFLVGSEIQVKFRWGHKSAPTIVKKENGKPTW